MKQIEERGGDFAANYEILDDNGRRKNECEIARESYISGAKCEQTTDALARPERTTRTGTGCACKAESKLYHTV